MSKYIPADKLIAKIEQRKQIHKNNLKNGFPDETNKIHEDDDILSIISSLQQEQPEDMEENQKPVVQWPNLSNCKHDCKACFARCFYRKEQNEEQQTDVDLEKESVMFCFDNGINISPRQAKNIARHFWNKGYNAGKEKSE